MWALDLSHTAHTLARTGIQQVSRELARLLAKGDRARPFIFDRYARRWRPPDSREWAHIRLLDDGPPPKKRRSSYSHWQRLRGRWERRWRKTSNLEGACGILTPEIFEPVRDQAYEGSRPTLAIFHDAVPFTHPEWTPRQTVERFPAYLNTLARFDRVICVSEASRQDLLAAWASLGTEPVNAPLTLRLGLPESRMPRQKAQPNPERPEGPRLLCVGTLEARKNHAALLDACAHLWSSGLHFSLKLVGMLNRETGGPAAARIAALQASGHPLTWDRAASDANVMAAYREADLFLYPSLAEGFGLPVVEALAHGLPVLLGDNSALREHLAGGGCTASGTDAGDLVAHLGQLLRHPEDQRRLTEEARLRNIRTMADFARELPLDVES
jgi:glycosyltransferase involved in cell wall biosynthesis